jgi:diguanylate cyclase (GGDEF)-like protein
LLKISNRSGIIILISIILLGGFLTINYISYLSAKASLRDNIIYSSLPLTRDNIYSEIQKDIMRPIFVSSLMANDTFLKDWVLGGETELFRIRKYLDTIKDQYGLFISFFVSDISKKYYYENGYHKTISEENDHDQWYFNFIKKHTAFELNIDTSEAKNNQLAVFINYRVYDYMDNLIGVTGVGLSLDRITNLLTSYSIKYDRNIYLVGSKGLIKAHENSELIESKSIYEFEGLSEFADEILQAAYNPKIFEFDRNGERILLTTRYIPELEWYLFVEQNQDHVVKNIKHNLLSTSILGLFVTLIIITIVVGTVHSYNRQLEKLAITDELTGSFNRREFERLFKKAVQQNEKTGDSFSVLLVDIDHFKQINDNYGHLVGDEVIKQVTELSENSVRDKDILTRWGGDEFMLLVYGETETALSIAERISENVKKSEKIGILLHNKGMVTLSIGVTNYQKGDDVDSITKRVDDALYKAKEDGRDKIVQI